ASLIDIIGGRGGVEVYFLDPFCINWDGTIVFWLFDIALFFTLWFGRAAFVERLMGHLLECTHSVTHAIWIKLNWVWMIFFLLVGTLNVFVAYYLSTNAWVNFKLYGVLGAFILFAVVQSFYLAKYIEK